MDIMVVLYTFSMQVPSPRRSEVVLPPLETKLHPPAASFRAAQPVSISLPASPGSFGVPTPTARTTADSGDLRRLAKANTAARGSHCQATQDKEAVMFMSQPISGPSPARLGSRGGRARRTAPMNWDKRYDSFKTSWSGKLERQITHLAGGGPDGLDYEGGKDTSGFIGGSHRTCASSVPEVDRFYAALEGPELEQLKVVYYLHCVFVSSSISIK